mmetsp:Transcript_43317/g.144278  ORF Transcript_43317/g.144278 Transcript_43317/m.144278 type:complete len:349 (-) Transcript_43317:528-1574(-)
MRSARRCRRRRRPRRRRRRRLLAALDERRPVAGRVEGAASVPPERGEEGGETVEGRGSRRRAGRVRRHRRGDGGLVQGGGCDGGGRRGVLLVELLVEEVSQKGLEPVRPSVAVPPLERQPEGVVRLDARLLVCDVRQQQVANQVCLPHRHAAEGAKERPQRPLALRKQLVHALGRHPVRKLKHHDVYLLERAASRSFQRSHRTGAARFAACPPLSLRAQRRRLSPKERVARLQPRRARRARRVEGDAEHERADGAPVFARGDQPHRLRARQPLQARLVGVSHRRAVRLAHARPACPRTQQHAVDAPRQRGGRGGIGGDGGIAHRREQKRERDRPLLPIEHDRVRRPGA